MQYQRLGTTGMEVSRICLGTMSFGTSMSSHSWGLGEKESMLIIKRALNAGINFIDTANIYSMGVSEEIVGKVIHDTGVREDVVLATKFFCNMHEGPNGGGASRKSIMREIDASLKRLQTDYIDLYILHRWDDNTPIEETMQTLDDLVRAGKVRYIGASAMYAWQFQKAMNVADKYGWTKFVSMQNHLNLLYREEEREMLPYCRNAGVGITPYKPLAAGRLTRPKGTVTERFVKDRNSINKYYGKTEEQDNIIIDRVGEVAERNGVSRLDVAIAWILQKEPVSAAICGVTKESHVDGIVHAADVILSDEDIAYLEEAYIPHELNTFGV